MPDIPKAIKLTLSKVSQDIRSEAVVNSPYKTGTLRRSIMAHIEWNEAKVGSNLPYARMREYGGIIKPNRKKMLAWKNNWKWYFAKQVTQKGKPYLIPAFEKNTRDIGKILKQFITSTTR
jgi:phage gpG-like protein